MTRLIGFLFVVVTVSACSSDSPAPAPSPPPPASVAGNWTGTWSGTQLSGGSYLIALVMNLSQANSAVSGTWATSQANGTVSGTTTTSSFSGTFTWNAFTTIGTPCTGTFAVSGAAGGNTLNWNSVGVTGNCTNLPTGIAITTQVAR